MVSPSISDAKDELLAIAIIEERNNFFTDFSEVSVRDKLCLMWLVISNPFNSLCTVCATSFLQDKFPSGQRCVSARPNVLANRHFTVGRVWARIFAQTWHAVKCPVERIRRDFPPFRSGAEAPRLSCVYQPETEKGEVHERDYTSADSAGRC